MYHQALSLTTGLLEDFDIPAEDEATISLNSRKEIPETVTLCGKTYTRRDVVAKKLGYISYVSVINACERNNISTVLYQRIVYLDEPAFRAWAKKRRERAIEGAKRRWSSTG